MCLSCFSVKSNLFFRYCFEIVTSLTALSVAGKAVFPGWKTAFAAFGFITFARLLSASIRDRGKVSGSPGRRFGSGPARRSSAFAFQPVWPTWFRSRAASCRSCAPWRKPISSGLGSGSRFSSGASCISEQAHPRRRARGRGASIPAWWSSPSSGSTRRSARRRSSSGSSVPRSRASGLRGG